MSTVSATSVPLLDVPVRLLHERQERAGHDRADRSEIRGDRTHQHVVGGDGLRRLDVEQLARRHATTVLLGLQAKPG